MRVAFISYYMTFGGIERQITMLANQMYKRGHEAIIISMVGDNICYEINEGIKKITVKEKGKGAIAILNRYLGLYSVLAKIKPDVTIAFMYQPAYLCAMMPKSIVGRLLYSERCNPGDSRYRGLLGLIRALTINRIDGFVFQLRGARDYFGKKIREKSTIIPNPVLIKKEQFKNVGDRRKVIVNVGRLHRQKNQEALIRAYAIVHEHHPDYTLEIYGEGELESELKKLAYGLGLYNKVLFKGTTDRLHDKIVNASMFVLTSDYEGLPNALIEAMALGIPCISTDCAPGGAMELINHGKDGIIVPKADIGAIADEIKRLIENPELAETMGEKASENIQRYKPEKIYNMWNEFLTELSRK